MDILHVLQDSDIIYEIYVIPQIGSVVGHSINDSSNIMSTDLTPVLSSLLNESHCVIHRLDFNIRTLIYAFILINEL